MVCLRCDLASVAPGRYFQLVALMIAAPRMALIGAAVFS
jgi:hypothetical protein